MMSQLIRALAPSRVAYTAPGLALAASLLVAGATQAQTTTVNVAGLSAPAAHAAIAKAATRVCGEGAYNPFHPTVENGCVERTIALAVRQVPAVSATSTEFAANRASAPAPLPVRR